MQLMPRFSSSVSNSLALAIALGTGAFYAVYSGMILAPEPNVAENSDNEDEMLEALPLPELVFVPIQPMVINLGKAASSKYLKFEAQLEVVPKYENDVVKLLPRITDVLNTFLRAVDVAKLEEPTAMLELRGQMLRRMQIVTGEGRIRDLLIMEFVLN